jgi:hypothetical protein
MAKNIYPCSQEQLYATAETAWNLHLINIGDFTKFRKAYSTHNYEEKVQEIKLAMQMKPLKASKKELLLIKSELVAAKKDVLHNYKCTVEFIKMNKSDTIIPFESNTKRYRMASNNNWLACKQIAHESFKYTSDYFEQLTSGDNMPETFAKECKDMYETFDKLYFKYELKKRDIKSNIFLKVTASNTIYTNLTTMLRHAQLIYRNREDMQVLFQFDKLLRKAKNVKKENTKKVIVKPQGIFSKVAAMF